jgi:hypothetical protein
MKKIILLTVFLFLSFTAYSQTITSNGTGSWSDGATWVGGVVPNNSNAVVIANGHTVTCATEQDANTLTVNNGGSLTISKDGALTVSSTVTNAAGATGIIIVGTATESGSLIAKSGSSPTISVDIYVPSAQWKLLGLPVVGEIVDDVDATLDTSGSKIGLGLWDVSSSSWDLYLSSETSSELLQNRGYEIKRSTASGPGTIRFSGSMRTSNRTSSGTATNKWSLVGNPFPSYLRLTNDATGNNASGDANNYFLDSDHLSYLPAAYKSVYGWDGSAYASYSNTDGAGGGAIDVVMPGDAFFVYTNGAEVFSLKEDYQVHDGGRGFRSSTAQGSNDESNSPRTSAIKFAVNDNVNTKKYLTIFFADNETSSLDPGSDIGAFPYGDFDVYTQLVEDDSNGIDFTVQSLPYKNINDVVIPMGVKTEIGLLKFSFVENTLPNYIDMYLEDTQENTFKKITDGFEINFDEAYEGLGRFYLHFTDQLIPELPTDDNLRIYKGLDSDVMVMGSVGKNYSAKVYDYSGRLIKEVNFNHKTKINDLDSKMKILRIESEEGLTIKKFKLN